MKSTSQSPLCQLTFITGLFLLVFAGCKKEDPVTSPLLTTLTVTEITVSNAKSGGEITSDGGGRITSRGVVWGTSTYPATDNHTGITDDGSGSGGYVSNLTGLSPYITYYLRAYASNSAGTSYGNELQFTTEGLLAVVTTASVGRITQTSAFAGGNVTMDGTPTVNARGIVWSTWHTPTVEINLGRTINGTGSGSFSSSITGLTPETTYYVRAYATSVLGTTYGMEEEFNTTSNDGLPWIGMPSFTDSRDGNVYNTVQIGDQCWMVENLKYLPVVHPGSASVSLEVRYHVYDYAGDVASEAALTDNYKNYGVLYTWMAALDACPDGWHLPSYAEFTKMTDYLMNKYNITNSNNDINALGNVLKSRRQVDSPLGGNYATTIHPRWDYHATHYGTDAFGFSAFPGGSRGGTFNNLGTRGSWWTSTGVEGGSAWAAQISHEYSYILYQGSLMGINAFSVRCLKD